MAYDWLMSLGLSEEFAFLGVSLDAKVGFCYQGRKAREERIDGRAKSFMYYSNPPPPLLGIKLRSTLPQSPSLTFFIFLFCNRASLRC